MQLLLGPNWAQAAETWHDVQVDLHFHPPGVSPRYSTYPENELRLKYAPRPAIPEEIVKIKMVMDIAVDLWDLKIEKTKRDRLIRERAPSGDENEPLMYYDMEKGEIVTVVRSSR